MGPRSRALAGMLLLGLGLSGPARAKSPLVADINLAVDGSAAFARVAAGEGETLASASGVGATGGGALAVSVVPRLAIGVAAQARHVRRRLRGEEPDPDVGPQQQQNIDLMAVVVGSSPRQHHVLHHQLGAGYSLGRGTLLGATPEPEPSPLRGLCIDYGAHIDIIDKLGDGAWRRHNAWTLGLHAGFSLHLPQPAQPGAYFPDATGAQAPDLGVRFGISTHLGGPPTRAEAKRKQQARKRQRKKKTREPREHKNTGPGRR